jgi:hypothetical protein
VNANFAACVPFSSLSYAYLAAYFLPQSSRGTARSRTVSLRDEAAARVDSYGPFWDPRPREGRDEMRVTAWNNGSHRSAGAGYGIRVSPEDRDLYFSRDWDHVVVDLVDSGRTAISLSESFWAGCTELRSADVGRWLITQRLAPWPKGSPPSLLLAHIEGNAFRLSRSAR